MSDFNMPRRGSISYYPRVRAKKQTPSLKGYGSENKLLNFLCYKVGMTQAIGKNVHKLSPTYNQEVVVPVTVVECPPMKVFGVRAYTKAEIGVNVLKDVIVDNPDSKLSRKMNNFKKKKTKKKVDETKKEKKEVITIEQLEKDLNEIEYFTLLVNTQPSFKKTPDITEIFIGGTKEEQYSLAKEKIGKEITINELFEEGDFLDVRGVTKGKGFQGVVKRFGVKMFRPKHKKRRVVGSIGPWHPHTVMWTVARPGQMGYHNRVESNKKLLKISTNPSEVNPKAGFTNFGLVKGTFALIFGSIPGPAKRCVAIRKSTRPTQQRGVGLEKVEKILN